MTGPGSGMPLPDGAAGARQAPTELRFQGADATRIDPADWARRAAQVRAELATDHVDDVDLDAVLATFQFTDDSNRAWAYNGGGWLVWNGTAWAAGTPAGPLRLASFSLGVPVEDVPDVPAAAGGDEPAGPTHLAPPAGLQAWTAPDPSSSAPIAIAGGTPLQVLEWQPTGWARVMASNGWTGWVDGRKLLPIAP